ncbi:hypothetical protein POM88_029917 [Heracleum sosnowskyi]|uniref:Uncharacterized protein n=1 Tax=Heracleum sosnowskyi TaxID=360622 RepID=A0AAD8HVS6_9APIA|nr:hypothetical protein POM88_029917 [Heracleum sosnowskyi]
MDIDTLYTAAITGDPEAIIKLEKEADKLSTYDRTILHIESKEGNVERVQFIVKEFENKNLLIKLDAINKTALHLAADCGHTQVVKVLIDAAKRLTSSETNDPQNSVSCFQAFVRQANNRMNTALHLAVTNGHMAIAKLLVEADPSDRHIQNGNGDTPVYLAAKLGYNDIVKMICTTCTAPSLDGPQGTTALHAAIMKLPQEKKKDRDVVKELINAAKRSSSSEDAPINSFEALFNKTDNYRTVIDLAVRRNHLDVVELILVEDPAYQHGRTSKNINLKPLIYVAAEQGYKDMVILLCETYEAGNALGHKGQTALKAAIIARDKESVFRLLRDDKRLVIRYKLKKHLMMPKHINVGIKMIYDRKLEKVDV